MHFYLFYFLNFDIFVNWLFGSWENVGENRRDLMLSFWSGDLDNMLLTSLVEAMSSVWLGPYVIFTFYKSPKRKRKRNYFPQFTWWIDFASCCVCSDELVDHMNSEHVWSSMNRINQMNRMFWLKSCAFGPVIPQVKCTFLNKIAESVPVLECIWKK